MCWNWFLSECNLWFYIKCSSCHFNQCFKFSFYTSHACRLLITTPHYLAKNDLSQTNFIYTFTTKRSIYTIKPYKIPDFNVKGACKIPKILGYGHFKGFLAYKHRKRGQNS